MSMLTFVPLQDTKPDSKFPFESVYIPLPPGNVGPLLGAAVGLEDSEGEEGEPETLGEGLGD